MLVGAAVGMVLMDNTGVGIALGAGIGLAIGSLMNQNDSEDEAAGGAPPDVEPGPEE